MPIRKNTKRIDPRYFLHETTHRDIMESDGPDSEIAAELAAVFQESPEIMAAVEKAAQDPKVQAAAEKALSQSGTMQEDEDPMGTAYRKRADKAGMGVAAGAGLATSGLAATISPAALAAVGKAAAATSVGALGFTAGPALMAVGMLLIMKSATSRIDNNFKADNPNMRSRADFSDEEYKKMYDRD